MLDEPKEEEALNEMTTAEALLLEAKTKKGIDKIILLGKSLIAHAKALTLYDKCEINDDESLLCFVCVRYPDLDLDWVTMQKILSILKNKEIDYQAQKTLEIAIIVYNSAIIEKINNIKH